MHHSSFAEGGLSARVAYRELLANALFSQTMMLECMDYQHLTKVSFFAICFSGR